MPEGRYARAPPATGRRAQAKHRASRPPDARPSGPTAGQVGTAALLLLPRRRATKWEQPLARGRSQQRTAPLLPVAPRRRGRPATPPPLGGLPASLCSAIRALRPPPLLKGWNGLRRSRAHRPLGRSAPAWLPRRRARRDDAAAEIFGDTAARFRPLFCTGSRGAGGGARLRRCRAARHGLAGTHPPCGDGGHLARTAIANVPPNVPCIFRRGHAVWQQRDREGVPRPARPDRGSHV